MGSALKAKWSATRRDLFFPLSCTQPMAALGAGAADAPKSTLEPSTPTGRHSIMVMKRGWEVSPSAKYKDVSASHVVVSSSDQKALSLKLSWQFGHEVGSLS